MSKEDERTLGTADLASAARAPQAREPQDREPREADRMAHETHGEPLAELFPAGVAQDFRSRWDAVQIGFVDDPKQAVKQADELVAQVMKSLADNFSRQRASIESDVGGSDQASTENLRLALRSYRSFFQRLLSL
jgi:hypothetical protein